MQCEKSGRLSVLIESFLDRASLHLCVCVCMCVCLCVCVCVCVRVGVHAHRVQGTGIHCSLIQQSQHASHSFQSTTLYLTDMFNPYFTSMSVMLDRPCSCTAFPEGRLSSCCH